MRLYALPALLIVLGACSPTLNWRTVDVSGTPLSVMLPCKPDQATREVDWGKGPQPLAMLGCEAGGATWAVSHLLVAQPTDAPAVAEQWQQALQKQLQLPRAVPGSEPFLIKNGLELPQARAVAWQGRDAQGNAVFVDARWFVRLEGGGARVYQAMVLSPGKPVDRTARDSFVQGLQLHSM